MSKIYVQDEVARKAIDWLWIVLWRHLIKQGPKVQDDISKLSGKKDRDL